MGNDETGETMDAAVVAVDRQTESAASEQGEQETLHDVKEELTAPSTPPSTAKDDEKGEVVNDSEPAQAAEETPEPTADDISQSEYKDIARKMFKEDFVSIQPEEYTQFLAANDEESSKIRGFYMDLFNWDPNLLKSTRMLCSKLYLKGESQEIDRILTSFTKSYVRQHPNNIFCTRNFEKIYIVIYSLILLNTALHNSELNKKSKISQTEYIRNTFTTFIQQDPKNPKKLSIKQRIIIERELSHFYDDIARRELYLKQADDEKGTKPAKSGSAQESSPMQQQKRAQHPSTYSTGSSGIAHLSRTPSHNNESEYNLSRQVSNSSIWSTDTTSNRRSSLAMQRMNSGTSGVSHFTSAASARVGFTRALLSDSNQKLYRNNNNSHNSNISSATTIRNRQSYDQMRVASNQSTNRSSGGLTKRASRASIISKESTQEFGDDTMSVLSFDSTHLNNLDIGDDNLPQQQLEDFDVNDYQDRYDLTLELQGSPYLKEGLLKLKILNNDQQDNNATEISSSSSVVSTSSSTGASRFFSFFRSSSNNNTSNNTTGNAASSLLPNKFVENFVVVSKGELSLYSFDPKIIKKHQQKMNKFKHKKLITLTALDEEEDENVGDGNWLKNAANIGNYNLCSTIAQLEKQGSGTQSRKSILWSLTFPKVSKKPAKKFIFEAGTREIALEFINTCNFWAAKITAIPTLEESVSSIEYGWTNLENLINNKDQLKKRKNIHKWEPLPKGVYLSNYVAANGFNGDADHSGMMKQFVKTLKYYTHLKKLYQDFSKMKMKFIKSFPSKQYASSNYARIVGNYDTKIAEYRADLQKYKNYVIILGFGLQLRFDLEEEDAEQEFESNDIGENADAGAAKNGEREEEKLAKLVKLEIGNLFVNMTGIGDVIPTFQSSKSLNNMKDMVKQQKDREADDGSMSAAFTLVKSPKTYTLSNFKETESPITQLLQSTSNEHESHNDFSHSFSTNTIKEEEEPEEQEIARSSHIRAGSNGSTSANIHSMRGNKLPSVGEVQATNAVGQSA